MTSCRLPATSVPTRPTGSPHQNPNVVVLTPFRRAGGRTGGSTTRFPACVNVTSALASIVWVYGPTKACFDPAIPGCVMPDGGTNISQTPGAFPVDVTKIRESLHQASLTGEVCVAAPRGPHGLRASDPPPASAAASPPQVD